VRCSLFSVREGLRAKEMSIKRTKRRRIEITPALLWPTLLRISRYCRITATDPRRRRRKISQKGKTGASVI
jgi:hypothetical protein